VEFYCLLNAFTLIFICLNMACYCLIDSCISISVVKYWPWQGDAPDCRDGFFDNHHGQLLKEVAPWCFMATINSGVFSICSGPSYMINNIDLDWGRESHVITLLIWTFEFWFEGLCLGFGKSEYELFGWMNCAWMWGYHHCR
jgi:hypothetical protein